MGDWCAQALAFDIYRFLNRDSPAYNSETSDLASRERTYSGKCVRPGPNHVSNHTHRESTRNRTYVKFIGDLCQVFKQVFYLLKLFAGGQFEVGHISNRKIQSKNQKFSLDFQ